MREWLIGFFFCMAVTGIAQYRLHKCRRLRVRVWLRRWIRDGRVVCIRHTVFRRQCRKRAQFRIRMRTCQRRQFRSCRWYRGSRTGTRLSGLANAQLKPGRYLLLLFGGHRQYQDESTAVGKCKRCRCRVHPYCLQSRQSHLLLRGSDRRFCERRASELPG